MTGRRWPSAPDRTTSRRLWLGFGTLTALLVLSTIAILARIQSIEWHVVETASDARRIAILHDVQGIVSFASALLIVSASVAVVMSTVVGSGIVKAERELWASREGLRVTLASIGDAVITTDASGNVTYLNAVAKDLTGWTQDDAPDRSLAAVFKIIDERTRQPVDNPVREVLRLGQVLQLANHTILVNKDGTERPIDDSAAPIRDDQGRVVGVVLVFHDITERRIAEHALRRSERELTEGLRDADRRKDEFLATLAHELRDPLAAMRSSLEVMRRCAADVGTLQLARDAMERQSRQLLRLVDDLLDVNRITHDKIELRKTRVELASIVDQAVDTCRPAVESAAHELTVTLPKQPLYLHADAVRLVQVFSNLLNNSCKYSEPRGRIALTAERQGSDVVVTVKDAGIGIAPDLLPTIFDMFTQGKPSSGRSNGGLGIGLTVVRRFVTMHGGSVSASSAGPGRGSEFVVRLPLLCEPVPPQPPATVDEPMATTARSILVVDDNHDSAMALSMVLQLAGHQTHAAHDGLEAVQAAATFRPDVVLLDIGLPKVDGYEAARRIRQQPWGRAMLLVALTGCSQEEDSGRSAAAGFDAYLVKPVDLAALTKLLAALPAPVSA